MNDDASCTEAEAMARLLAIRDLLDLALWAETDPVRAIDIAVPGLHRARRLFVMVAADRGVP